MKTRRRTAAGQDGHTLVELSVVLVLGGLLAALCFQAVGPLQKALARRMRDEAVRQTNSLLLHRLADDLAGAFEVRRSIDPDTAWTLVRAAAPPVRYELRDGLLLRQGVRAHDASVRVTTFDLSLVPSLPERRCTRLRLAVAAGEMHRGIDVVVSLRGPAPWPLTAGGGTLR